VLKHKFNLVITRELITNMEIDTSKQLLDIMKRLGKTKAFIITGKSLSGKTPVIKDIVKDLGSAHGGTFNSIGAHA
jgi:3-oxoacid CoA-transferase